MPDRIDLHLSLSRPIASALRDSENNEATPPDLVVNDRLKVRVHFYEEQDGALVPQALPNGTLLSLGARGAGTRGGAQLFLQSGNAKTGTATAATNLINVTAHGLRPGQLVTFPSLSEAGLGLSLDARYYVIADGLATNAFKVSLTESGAAVDITGDLAELVVVPEGGWVGGGDEGATAATARVRFVEPAGESDVPVEDGDLISLVGSGDVARTFEAYVNGDPESVTEGAVPFTACVEVDGDGSTPAIVMVAGAAYLWVEDAPPAALAALVGRKIKFTRLHNVAPGGTPAVNNVDLYELGAFATGAYDGQRAPILDDAGDPVSGDYDENDNVGSVTLQQLGPGSESEWAAAFVEKVLSLEDTLGIAAEAVGAGGNVVLLTQATSGSDGNTTVTVEADDRIGLVYSFRGGRDGLQYFEGTLNLETAALQDYVAASESAPVNIQVQLRDAEGRRKTVCRFTCNVLRDDSITGSLAPVPVSLIAEKPVVDEDGNSESGTRGQLYYGESALWFCYADGQWGYAPLASNFEGGSPP